MVMDATNHLEEYLNARQALVKRRADLVTVVEAHNIEIASIDEHLGTLKPPRKARGEKKTKKTTAPQAG